MNQFKTKIDSTRIRKFIETREIKYSINIEKEAKRILNLLKKETKRNKLEKFVNNVTKVNTVGSSLEGIRSSESNENLSLYTKALSLLSNQESEEEWNHGLAFCKQCADLGNSDAQYICGIAIEDPSSSTNYLQQAAKQEHPQAQFELWIKESASLNDTQAIKWLKKSAINEYAIAQLVMGVLELIEGKTYNREDAFKWISQAAEQDNLHAQALLASMYAEGIGTKANQKLSFKYMLLAAERGDVYAQYKVGEAYDLGSGTDRYAKQALKWYRIAANNGYGHAQYRLGLMIFDGDETTPNAEEAMKLFEYASETVNIAKYPLGIGYVTGKGVPKDVRKGLMLLDEAAENEDDPKHSESIYNEILTFLTHQYTIKEFGKIKHIDISHEFQKTSVAKDNNELNQKRLANAEKLIESKFATAFKMPAGGLVRNSFIKTILTSLAIVFGALLLANVIFNFTAEFETLLMIVAGGFIASFLIGGGKAYSDSTNRAKENNKIYTPSRQIFSISYDLERLRESTNERYTPGYEESRLNDIKKRIYDSFGIVTENKNKNNYIIIALIFVLFSIFFGIFAGIFFSIVVYITLIATPMFLHGLFTRKSKEAALKKIDEVEYNFHSYLDTLLNYHLLTLIKDTGANSSLFAHNEYSGSNNGYFYIECDIEKEVEMMRKHINISLSIRSESLYRFFLERTIYACQLHVQMQKIKKAQDGRDIIDPYQLDKVITWSSYMLTYFIECSLSTADFLYFDPARTVSQYNDSDSERMIIAEKLSEYFLEVKRKQEMSGLPLSFHNLSVEFLKNIVPY